MKESLKAKIKEERDQMRESVRQELIQEHSAELQKLRDEHDAGVSKLKEEHRAELDRLTKEGGVALEKAEGASPAVKSESTASGAAEWPTEEQVLSLMKTNQRVRGIVNNNINKRVSLETEKLQKAFAEKDEEIAKLKEAQTTATGDEEKKELRKKLETAEKEKETIRLAAEQEGKKAKVQANIMGIAQAKLAVVRKAVQETPEKPVKEVWEVADKAKPTPKPVPGNAPPSSPATAVAPKPTVAPSPTPASAVPATPAQTEEMSEEEKIRQRQQRFGTGPLSPAQAQASPRAGSFGQPSVPAAATTTTLQQAAPATGGTFGQPSQVASTGALGQPARRPSTSSIPGPNPQAPAFTPNADGSTQAPQQNAGTGPAALHGIARGGGIPRGGATRGGGQFQIQGAATAQQNQSNPSAAPRGGGPQSGIPRGGPGGIGRGGRGGGPPRGGANAGQKRPHDGGESGDGKRMRGGGPGGS